MLTDRRKRYILDRLARDGQIVARTLSAELEISEDTIRRDLRELAREGLLLRVHGGAMPASPTTIAMAGRRTLSVGAKVALGRAAAALIGQGQTVFLDGGTTHAEIVRALPVDLAFTAITHSPTLAVEFESRPAVDVFLVGGKLFRHSMVATGAMALESIGRLRADLFFLGATGVHPKEGVTTGDVEEAALKRAIVARSAETVILATAEKLGAVSAFQIVPLADVAMLIVAPDSPTTGFAETGLKVVVA